MIRSKMDSKLMTNEIPDGKTLTKSEKSRITWNNKYEFAFNVLGFSIGLGNIWRFSYLCFKNGGGAFLVPFLLVAGLGSLPLLFMEISLGQYTRHGCVAAWDIVPLMRGIGLSSMMLALYYCISFPLALSWCVLYLYHSFTTGPLPWATCDNFWNTNSCVPIIQTNLNDSANLSVAQQHLNLTKQVVDARVLSTAEFWDKYVLQRTDGIHDLGTFSNWKMVGCFLLSWVACYLCIAKGIRTSGKVAYFTVLIPYLLMIALFFRGVTLEGASDGILYYITPNMTKLGEPTVWLDAGSQVMFSIGVCYGMLICFGSYNKTDFNCYKSSYFFVFTCYGSSLFFGFVVFCFIGHMAHTQHRDVSEVVEGGPGLVFQVFPAELALLPLPQLWSAVFFMTLTSLAVDSVYATAEGGITALADYLPERFSHKGTHIWRIFVCSLAMLLGLPQLFDGGIYIFELINLYGGSGICILWVAIFESVSVAWIYGIDRFLSEVESMIKYKPPIFFKYCLKFVTPIFCLTIFIAFCVKHTPLKLGDYSYPLWANVIGWLLSLSVVACVPIVAAVVLWQTPGSLKKRLQQSVTPKEEQGKDDFNEKKATSPML